MDSRSEGARTGSEGRDEPRAPGAPGAVRRGGKGALIGALFGGAWYLIGITGLRGGTRQAAAAAGALLLVAVVLAVVRLRRTRPAPPSTPAPSTPAPSPGGRGRAFTRLVVVQAVLLGVGGGLISTRLHQPQAVFAWAALVVGGHFFPLARVLGAPMLKVLGALMVALAAAAAVLATTAGGGRAVWQGLPGLGCAAALWGAVLVSALRAPGRTGGAGAGIPARP